MALGPKKFLITGAEGFIGSHLTEELIKSGHDVRAMVMYNFQNSWGWLEDLPNEILDNAEIFTGDIRNWDSVRQAVRGCDIIFHLAALIGIPYSYQSPEAYVDTNIKGTLNMLQAAREYGVEKIVHTSTSEVYGTARFVPITEEHPLQPQSPYSATKIAADQIALSFYNSFGTPVAIIRPFNTYGPRQSARAVIPTIITQLVSGNHQIKLGDQQPTRDFNYVKDTVAGFIAMAAAEHSVGEIINIGSNYEISIGDTARLIAEIMGIEVEIITETDRLRPKKSEVKRLWADNTKAKQLLGWEPVYGGHNGFRKGLVETINWFSDPTNLKKYKVHLYNV